MLPLLVDACEGDHYRPGLGLVRNYVLKKGTWSVSSWTRHVGNNAGPPVIAPSLQLPATLFSVRAGVLPLLLLGTITAVLLLLQTTVQAQYPSSHVSRSTVSTCCIFQSLSQI